MAVTNFRWKDTKLPLWWESSRTLQTVNGRELYGKDSEVDSAAAAVGYY